MLTSSQTSTPTLTKVVEVPPAFTPTVPAPGPAILYFRASVEEASPGDTIVLEWAYICEEPIESFLYFPTFVPGHPSYSRCHANPTGSMSYTVHKWDYNPIRFTLLVCGRVQEEIAVTLHCPDQWFFAGGPKECPSGPAITSPGAEEHFERGAMVWVRALDRIYVLYGDGQPPRWEVFTDEFEEGMPESDPNIVPPPGLYQPIRGFGKLWREKPWVRDRLGWAVDQEVGFDTAVQSTSRPCCDVAYIQALDGGVWELAPGGDGWSHISP
jgi:hypothetical protein